MGVPLTAPDRPPPGGDPTLLRSVAAVAAGFATLAIGVMVVTRVAVAALGVEPGQPPERSFLALNVAYSAVLSVLAGWLTAKAAPRAPRVHAAALAGVLLFLSGAALLGARGQPVAEQPSWYPYLKLLLGPAGAIAGGWWFAGRREGP